MSCTAYKFLNTIPSIMREYNERTYYSDLTQTMTAHLLVYEWRSLADLKN